MGHDHFPYAFVNNTQNLIKTNLNKPIWCHHNWKIYSNNFSENDLTGHKIFRVQNSKIDKGISAYHTDTVPDRIWIQLHPGATRKQICTLPVQVLRYINKIRF
jgi:hypothetical protein